MKTLNCVVSLGIALALPAHAVVYQVVDLGSLHPDEISEAFGLNERGDVAGISGVKGNGKVMHAIAVRSGVMQDLGELGGHYSTASAINERGHVVGWSSKSDGSAAAFIERGHGMQELGTLGGVSSAGIGINRAGHVVGFSDVPEGWSHAFLYRDGTMTDLGTLGGRYSLARDINDLGQIVGEAATLEGPDRAFLYQGGVMSDLGTLGGSSNKAMEINAHGQVTGTAETADGTMRAFLFADGTMKDIGQLPGRPFCDGKALNDRAQVVGQCRTVDWQRVTPFVFRGGRMHDVNRMLDPVSGAGWLVKSVDGINNAGQIAGNGSLHGGPRRALLLVPLRP